ncbi:hypothetical protein AB0F93_31845 [Micromonospora tulbaghiae]|uniref:hypothetical protein n=1 Tax=Micromonospora TaxID=1873 RepID=UPI00207C1218|nr:hypothetical protein [Micromonospora sp. CPM1]MCO1618065.1 hypothetical protein [Micromonospora sp. CPM1]
MPEEPDEDLLMHEESVLAGLVELSGVEILWCDDFYDGAIDGLARWDGREFWFAGVYPLDRRPRRYVLHEISAMDVEAASALHRLLGENADAARHGRLDSTQERAWSQAWASRPDYRRAPAVGWFSA